jgi:RHS repeat-associated protein
MRKEVNEVITDYVLEGGKVILETTGSDELHYSYDSWGQLVSLKLNGTPYFYTRNGQGDITGLIDASGVEVVKYTYDSWGKPVSITGSLATTVGAKNPYRYRGYRYDHESGLYYLQSRYYDPSIKRFISADGKTHSHTYDLLGRLSGTSLNTTTPYTTALTYKTNPSTGSSSHVLNSYRSGSTTTTYQVDASGNITQLSDRTRTFTYIYPEQLDARWLKSLDGQCY